jgi:hypothetical protein
MNVVEHRPPLRRIEIGARPIAPAVADLYETDTTAELAEQTRIWVLLKQSAQGCNPAGGEI